MHREVLAQRIGAAGHIDDDADPGAVNVRRDPTFRFATREAADRDVLTDLLHERDTARFDGFARRELRVRKRGDIGRIVANDELGDLARERLEVVVLGNEVGFAIHLDHRGNRAAWRHVQSDHAFCGDAIGGLARFGAAANAQKLLGLCHVAGGFGQRLLALHHAETGALAQVHHHACGNVRHLFNAPVRFAARQRHGHRDPSYDRAAGNHAGASSATSTNSSPPWTISCTDWLLPSSTASATPRAYKRIARLESSFPGITYAMPSGL